MKTCIVLALLLAACSADSESAGGGGGAGGSTTANGSAGGDAGSGGGDACPDPEQGMFACDDTLSCEELSNHLGWGDTPEASACAGQLIDGNGTGLVRAVSRPGPGPHEDWWLVAPRGDGAAWVQTRHYYDDNPTDDDDPCWVIDPILVCNVVAACECPAEDSCSCTWDPGSGPPGGETSSLAGCVPADVPPTCDEIAALIDG